MKKRALLAAVNRYQLRGTQTTLKYCVSDARQLGVELRQCGFEVGLILEQNATRQGIAEALRWLRDGIGPDDIIVLGMFMHGAHARISSGETRRAFLPHDFERGSPLSALERNDILHDLEKTKARWRICLFDACRNQELEPTDLPAGDERPRGPMPRNLHLSQSRTNTLIIDACSDGEQAHEDDRYRHGFFSHFLIEGIANRERAPDKLSGWTDDGLDFNRLAREVAIAVPKELASQHPEYQYSNGVRSDDPVVVALIGDAPYPAPEVELPVGTAAPVDVDLYPEVEDQDPDKDDEPGPAPTLPDPQRWQLPIGTAIGALALLALALTGVVMVPALLPRPLGQGALCAASPPKAVTQVLLDIRRGQLTNSMRDRVADVLVAEAKALPNGGLIELRRLDPAGSNNSLLFSDCKPALPTPSMAETDPNTRFSTGWSGVLAQALDETAAPSPDQPAPLVAALWSIDNHHLPARADNTLVVVSNLIEDSPLFTLRGEAGWAEYRESDLASRYKVDLARVRATLLYVAPSGSDEARDTRLLNFWGSWLTDARVAAARFVHIVAAGAPPAGN